MMVEINDQKVWNEWLLSQRMQTGIFLQSWEWGEFQKTVGHKVHRYLNQDKDTIARLRNREIAQVIELPLPLGKKYWFIPRGEALPGLVGEAQKHGVWFIRFEPITSDGLRVKSYVKTRDISPPQTLIIDLGKSEEELLAQMHEKTRYNVRLAIRKGVEVRFSAKGGSASGGEEFWKLRQETAKRDKFSTHPREYYEKMLEVLSNYPSPQSSPTRGEEEKDNPSPLGRGEKTNTPLKVRGDGGVMHVRLHMAYQGITPVAGAIVGYFGDTATYLHGASSYEHRAAMGPYALHFQIMKEAKKEGYKFYDFWGVNTTYYKLHTTNSWAGMTRFKTGFGGQVVDYPGTFDLPLNKFWYTVYRLGRRMLP